jgi:allantoin racemase
MRIRIIRPAAREFRPLSPSELEEHKREWQIFVSPGTEIEVVRVMKGTETIEGLYDSEMAAPFILKEVKRAEQEGVDGVIIHCMGDPAFLAARELVDIPVLGEALSCFMTALMLGDKFSIMSTVPSDHLMYRRLVRIYGLEERLASIRSINIPVKDLRRDLNALKQAMIAQGKLAVQEDGAHVLIPGCGEIYGIAQEVTQEVGIPLIDPRATVIKMAEMLIGLALSHSKEMYRQPPQKRREI